VLDIASITEIVDHHGALLVTANTLLREIGIPVPVLPTLLVAGARSMVSDLNPALLLLGVVLGTIAGNMVWYVAGRRHGLRVLKLLCRLAITPDSCVGKTEATFQRWGAWSLSLGKFIPGVSLIASPLAGATGMTWGRFVVFNAIGGFLYALAGIGAGMIFHDEVDLALAALTRLGAPSLAVLGAAFAAYIAYKAWDRFRVRRALATARITVHELDALMRDGKAPYIADLRGPASREIDGRRIPGAIAHSLEAIEQDPSSFPRDRDIVFYCACPNEASAALASTLLIKRGYTRVRPLLGGLDAWVDAGFTVECTGLGEECARRRPVAAQKACNHGGLPEALPRSEGCEECVATGDRWTHLRVCLTCGHVGCCDDSKNRHASRHFDLTGHPVIRSIEAGEDWKWCYVDSNYVD
jgi:membrane protein DedA with SNARE-associated domain/rhodanese-related sulfurtransferase